MYLFLLMQRKGTPRAVIGIFIFSMANVFLLFTTVDVFINNKQVWRRSSHYVVAAYDIMIQW